MSGGGGGGGGGSRRWRGIHKRGQTKGEQKNRNINTGEKPEKLRENISRDKNEPRAMEGENEQAKEGKIMQKQLRSQQIRKTDA